MKRNLLIISNADSVYIKQYVEQLIKYSNDNEYSIYLLTRNNEVFSSRYSELGVNIIHYVRNYAGGKERLYKFLLRTKHKVKNYGVKFDYIHVHFVDRITLTLAKVLSNEKTKIIVSYWGSDIYRKGELAFTKEEPLLKYADKITFITEDMHSKFCNIYGDIFNNKCSIIDFGLEVIDKLAGMKEGDQLSARQEFGFGDEDIVIAVGYNINKEQQHLEVINSLGNLPGYFRHKICFYLHFGYGCETEGYVDSLIKEMERFNFRYVISRKFMDASEIAKLRCAVDIFINAQVTDALSASMLEYIYAGKIVINPVWLKYKLLDENNIKTCIYNEFSELPFILKEVIEKGKLKSDVIEHNKRVLYEIYSWQKAIKRWLELYK